MSNNITPREMQIAELISFGKTEKEMGNYLQLSVDTVKSHKGNLFTKTRSRNIADVTRWYFQKKTGYTLDPSLRVNAFIASSIVTTSFIIYLAFPGVFEMVNKALSIASASISTLIK